jgi:hypothetical protein
MTVEQPKPRSLKKLMLWAAALTAILLLWDRWNGALAVRSLCERDGGERIVETAYAPGLLVVETNYFCGRCIELIGNRQFEYVDALVRFVPSRRFPPGSYLRYSVGAQGAADCETWPQPETAALSLRRAGIEENECVRVQLLPGKPAGYALVKSRSELTVRGATIEIYEWRIEQIGTARVLAHVREYYYTSKLHALLDMSGQGGSPDETCMKPGEFVEKFRSLAARVLRDPARQPTNQADLTP